MIRRPPRSTPLYSSAASDVYKRQPRGGRVPRPAAHLRGSHPHGRGVPVLHRSPLVAASPRPGRDGPAAPRGGRRERPGGRAGATGQPAAVEPGPPGERRCGFLVGTAGPAPVSYTHLRAHETKAKLVCRLLLEKKKKSRRWDSSPGSSSTRVQTTKKTKKDS